MVDLKDLRENPQKYRRGAELKNVKVDVDGLLRADERRLSAQKEFEKYRAEQNDASKQISKIKDASEKQAAISRVSAASGDSTVCAMADRRSHRAATPPAMAVSTWRREVSSAQ